MVVIIFGLQTSLLIALYGFLIILFINSLIRNFDVLYDISKDTEDREKEKKEQEEDEKIKEACAKHLYS